MSSQDQVNNEFLNAMKEGDSKEVLKKAFKILTKDKNTAPVSADVLRRAMENWGISFTNDKVEKGIRQVMRLKADEKVEGLLINDEEFIRIIK